MDFKLTGKDLASKARIGQINTDHGKIQTPVFMPVGTAGAVKAVHHRELVEDIEAEIILGNTYHLYLRPGMEVMEGAGGLHGFSGWERPLLTDSGGYQVYSQSENRKIKEEGVTFKSHIDGSKHFFSPEYAIDIQRTIGADIIMAFDECTPYPCDFQYARDSMEMTHRWMERCAKHFDSTQAKYGYQQALFPIVQGSVYPELRRVSADFMSDFGRLGIAIGGLSVGEPVDLMYEMTDRVCEILPENQARYLMGVGTPANILECIAMGVDMFDCVMPTRNARNGMLFTTSGVINIRNEKWKMDFSPIDEGLESYVSTSYSKAYLRHLMASNEILGAQIASLQNLVFYAWLMNKARETIASGEFVSWKNQVVKTIMQRL